MNRRDEYEKLVLNMLGDKSYFPFAYIISLMEKNLNSSIETAAIWFNKADGKFHLELSNWFWSLPYQQQRGIIKHECLHMIMKHFSRFSFEGKTNSEKALMNIAMDMAINQYIEKSDLPSFAVYPSNYNFPDNLTAEQYLEMLKNQNSSNEESSNYSPIDDHEFMVNNQADEETVQSSAEKEMAESALDGIINSMKKNVGKLPVDIEVIIEKYKEKPQINWKKELRKYISKKSISKTVTIKKRSRRFPDRLDIRGKKANYESSVAVIVDISGSMSDKEIMDGLKEIDSICKLQNTELNIVQVDARARDVEKYSPKMKFERKGSGGTRLFPGVEQFNKEKVKYDVLIVISDMELFSSDINSFVNFKKPQIWLTQYKKEIFGNCRHIKVFKMKD